MALFIIVSEGPTVSGMCTFSRKTVKKTGRPGGARCMPEAMNRCASIRCDLNGSQGLVDQLSVVEVKMNMVL